MDAPSGWIPVAISTFALLIAGLSYLNARAARKDTREAALNRVKRRALVADAMTAGNVLRVSLTGDPEDVTRVQTWEGQAAEAIASADASLLPLWNELLRGDSLKQKLDERLTRLKAILDRI